MVLVLAGLLAGVSLGGIIYTTFLVAPTIFTVLDDPEATTFTRVLWPRYFWSQALLALVVEALLVYQSGHLPPAATAAGAAGLLMLINVLLAHRMSLLRDNNESDPGKTTSTYRWLHRISVWGNVTAGALMGTVLFSILHR